MLLLKLILKKLYQRGQGNVREVGDGGADGVEFVT